MYGTVTTFFFNGENERIFFISVLKMLSCDNTFKKMPAEETLSYHSNNTLVFLCFSQKELKMEAQNARSDCLRYKYSIYSIFL